MDYLKNITGEPAALASLIEVRPHQVVSMQLSRVPNALMTLFAFDDGEGVSPEVYPEDAFYLVVEGRMLLRVGREKKPMAAGECAAVPAGTAHGLRSDGPFKVLQIMLRNGGNDHE